MSNPWLVEYKERTETVWDWEHAGPFGSERMAQMWVDQALERLGTQFPSHRIEYRVRQYQPVSVRNDTKD